MKLILPNDLSGKILLVFTTLLAIYHLVVIAQIPTWFGYFIPQQSIRAISLAAATALIFFVVTDGSERRIRIGPVGGLLWLGLAASIFYVVAFPEAILDYSFFGELDTLGTVLALLLCVPLLEAIRRRTGVVLPIIILSFVAIALFQQFLPGLLHGRGYPLDRLLYSAYVGEVGVFGKPLGIAVNIIIVFLIFGALMERAGASRWFMDMALSLTGWARGGPAKTAVVASAMFGSISGSPSGNSATTGVLTIPMMKNVGYKPQFAAAVEAVASTGGMILPPVMGAIAFLMAEWIGESYIDVVIAALVPAALYFGIVFASVHFEARRNGIEALPKADIPDFLRTLTRGWYYFIPMAGLVYFLLFAAFQPGLAAIYASGLVILCSFLSPNREHWLVPRRIAYCFQDAVFRWLIIAAITGGVGIMIGAMELSGVGLNISRFIVEIGGGNVVLTIILVGVVSLIVGMGLDATPAYVTLATLMAPALIQLGVPPVAAHLYVIYWGLASFFTPPTCIAIFVTAPLAGAGVWISGWEAVRLGIAAFLVPVAFAINPSLLLIGEIPDILLAVSTATVGALAVAAGLRGFALRPLGMLFRAAFLLGGCFLIMPGTTAATIGASLVAVALIASTWMVEHRTA